MRNVLLLSVTAVVVAVVGCGSEGKEQATHPQSQRDLTRGAPALEVEVASPVELQQLPIRHQTVRPSRRTHRPVPAPRSNPSEPKSAPATVASAPAFAVPAAETVTDSAPSASDSDNDRALPPGKTVTVIPASSGPSTASEPTDEFPTARGGIIGIGGGGRCPPRRPGRGIGIATVPRPRLY
jgi:hypothetical protein